jgi:hypothetical protein
MRRAHGVILLLVALSVGPLAGPAEPVAVHGISGNDHGLRPGVLRPLRRHRRQRLVHERRRAIRRHRPHEDRSGNHPVLPAGGRRRPERHDDRGSRRADPGRHVQQDHRGRLEISGRAGEPGCLAAAGGGNALHRDDTVHAVGDDRHADNPGRPVRHFRLRAGPGPAAGLLRAGGRRHPGYRPRLHAGDRPRRCPAVRHRPRARNDDIDGVRTQQHRRALHLAVTSPLSGRTRSITGITARGAADGAPDRIVGVVLIVPRILALACQAFTYTTTEKLVELGPLKVEAERRKTVPLPPIPGGVAVVVGIVLVVV